MTRAAPIPIGESKDAGPVRLDLTRLIDTRLLIQANSGGGKSWLLRLLAEHAAPKVQTIILDPEGEFVTLREALDLVVVGRDGEIQPEPRAASLLARRLVELETSATIDLYDLHLADRRRFVRLFLESLMDLPKSLWRPILVLLDEAHKFCPERSAGEAESTQAVIDLCSQGRKRGFCAVIATQRLSKLHKDAAAECNNVAIGRTALDVDAKRAIDLLGMPVAEGKLLLRNLTPGEFLIFGPAIEAPGVVQFKSAKVKTTHPKAGERHQLATPKPSAAIRAVLSELADLPQQAEAEIRDLTAAKAKIAELERRLRADRNEADPATVQKAVTAAEERARQHYQREVQRRAVETDRRYDRYVSIVSRRFDAIQRLATKIAAEAEPHRPTAGEEIAATNNARPKPTAEAPAHPRRPPATGSSSLSRANREEEPVARRPTPATTASGRSGKRRMLIALAQHPEGLTEKKLALLAGLSKSGGTWGTYLSALSTAGQMERGGAGWMITAEGLAALGDYDPLPTGDALVAYWLSQLGGGGARRMLEALVQVYPDSLTQEQLAEAASLTASAGTFGTYLSRLRTLELVESAGAGIKASDVLFQS